MTGTCPVCFVEVPLSEWAVDRYERTGGEEQTAEDRPSLCGSLECREAWRERVKGRRAPAFDRQRQASRREGGISRADRRETP